MSEAVSADSGRPVFSAPRTPIGALAVAALLWLLGSGVAVSV